MTSGAATQRKAQLFCKMPNPSLMLVPNLHVKTKFAKQQNDTYNPQ